MINKLLETLKKNQVKNVAFGYSEIKIVSEEFDNYQIGYRHDGEGNSLYGINNGDWKESWYVIGTDTDCGDPIFVDISNPVFPVYTSIHGEGYWGEEKISESLDNFFETLKRINNFSKNRSNPVELENNPIDEIEKEKFIENICINGVGLEFWETFFEE